MNDNELLRETRNTAVQPDRNELAVIAMVETFDPRCIEGWIEAEELQFPVRVSLCVNDLEVAGTWADEPCRHNTQRTARGFRIILKDLWQFTQRTDRVSVRVHGRPIPIAKKGTYKKPGKNGPRSLAELQHLLRSDYLFSQVGRLQLSKKRDTQWQASVLGLYCNLGKILKQEFGYEPFLIYGTLLGLVREKGFIGHDIDFDCAYLSRHTSGPSAAAELRSIGLKLIDLGFGVECKRTALHVHDKVDPRIRIDLFDIYFNEQDELSFPFGIAGTTKIKRNEWQGLADAELGGQPVRIPANAEMMAELIYGKSWQTPITGFNWRRARTARAEEGWTPLEYSEEVYWSNFYAHKELTSGSPFCNFVLGRSDIPRTVLDIGCGDGRDTFAFARAGFTAMGLDRSQVGIRHAGQKAEQAGLGDKASFVAGDVSDTQTLQAVFARARALASDAPLLFYMRFFLHSIPEEVQEKLMTELAAAARARDMLAVEFRTDKDEGNRKVYGGHYRRYQNAQAFSEFLKSKCGFALSHEEEGSGLSPYKDEDPVLYRAIAIKNGP